MKSDNFMLIDIDATYVEMSIPVDNENIVNFIKEQNTSALDLEIKINGKSIFCKKTALTSINVSAISKIGEFIFMEIL